MYARILIDIKHQEVNRFFDYKIPDEWQDDIQVGMRVVVPFGRQTRMGYVIECIETSQNATKSVIEILDVIPTIQKETFLLIKHIKQHTNELYSTIFDTVVPAEMNLNYYQDVHIKDKSLIDDDFLKLFNKQGVFRVTKNQHQYDKMIRRYVRLNAVYVTPYWQQKAQAKMVWMYQYQKDHTYVRIDKYPVIKQLDDSFYTKNQLNEFGLTDGQIHTLLKHNVLYREKRAVQREIQHVYDKTNQDITLTDEQQAVYDVVKHAFNKHHIYLLKGVTGSGKTEVYLKWIKDVLDQNKNVMVLVPEIALIAPMAKRLESAFGDIAIYHSHLSKGERFDQYMKIKRGDTHIILGTRSAVFLPLDRIGMIIMDEAHDASYRQLERAAYDAKEIAEIRAKYHQCPLILGSATPDIPSMYQAEQGNYQLLTLNERPFGIKQPVIDLIDMREELKAKNTSMLSRRLREALEQRLAKKEQAIILFNRKGYAPFVMCRQCGDVPTCPTCGIALTYYQKDGQLKCHYCGYEKPFHKTCEQCHQPTVKSVGVGIEQVEHYLNQTFPSAKILRMDANQTKTKGAHEIIWHDFMNQKADILLGTQMIAKGLDFPKVTLVGVLMADLMLNTPSFRASENTYTLLMQVAGRSGRKHPGEVIIQGYDLAHYAIKDVLYNYDTFYKEAIYERQIMGYEPFMHVYEIHALGKGYLKTYQQAFSLKKALEKNPSFTVLGPHPAYIKKKGERFDFVMTIKTKSQDKTPIFKAIETYQSESIKFRFYPYQP